MVIIIEKKSELFLASPKFLRIILFNRNFAAKIIEFECKGSKVLNRIAISNGKDDIQVFSESFVTWYVHSLSNLTLLCQLCT